MDVEIHESGTTPGRALAFKSVLTEQCGRLGVELRLRPQVVGPGSPGGQRVALVFAERGSSWTSRQTAIFERLLRDGVSVLPVIPDPPAARFIPPALAHVNAFVRRSFGKHWSESLVDEVLGLAWLRRRTRKVFISYRRIDSGKIAAQLYERFNYLGYETFLDEASVRRGLDFQRELKWWLNDADLLLVLASPRFPLSQWCMEELTFCQQRFIGMAAIQWPREIYAGDRRLEFPQVGRKATPPVIAQAAMSDQQLTLRPVDFRGIPASWSRLRRPDLPSRELTAAALDRVIAMCAKQRTVAIRQRLDDLIPLARSMLAAGDSVVRTRELGDLSIRDKRGNRSFVRVLPFRPQPESLHRSYVDGAGYQVAGCFYAENDPQDARAEALRWLTSGIRAPGRRQPKGKLWACCGGVLL